jgi:DNA-binding transcriptional LysR family regulator
MGQSRAIDLNDLATFVAVADAQSFRQAAATLQVPKSTVSRRVAALEDALGETLLLRTTRNVSLTAAGHALRSAARGNLERLFADVHAIQNADLGPSGTLRVTAPAVGDYMLHELFAAYMKRFPQVTLEVEVTDAMLDVGRDKFDVAFRPGPLRDARLRARALGSSTLHVVASPSYLARHGTPRTPAHLREHACIVFASASASSRWPFRVGGRVQVIDVPMRCRVNTLLLARELAADGLGLARIPDAFCEDLFRRGELVRVLEKYAPPANRLYVATANVARVPARVRAFLDMLAEYESKLFAPVPRLSRG